MKKYYSKLMVLALMALMIFALSGCGADPKEVTNEVESTETENADIENTDTSDEEHAESQEEKPAATEGSSLLGENPVKLSLTTGDVVFAYYPGDKFEYDAVFGKIKSTEGSVGILFNSLLGENNLAELKASYEENNSSEEDYSLVETTVNGYQAQILKYSDWLGSTMRVDVDFGGDHDGVYGMSFCVSADTLEECDTDLIWAIIESFELAK